MITLSLQFLNQIWSKLYTILAMDTSQVHTWDFQRMSLNCNSQVLKGQNLQGYGIPVFVQRGASLYLPPHLLHTCGQRSPVQTQGVLLSRSNLFTEVKTPGLYLKLKKKKTVSSIPKIICPWAIAAYRLELFLLCRSEEHSNWNSNVTLALNSRSKYSGASLTAIA